MWSKAIVGLGFALTIYALVPAQYTVSRDGQGPDDLLGRFPLSDGYLLRSGARVPVPFHCFDGHATVLHGSADPSYARTIIRRGTGGALEPILTRDGMALATMWIMDYVSTGIGPYKELVVAYATAPKGSASLKAPCASTDASCGVVASGLLGRDVKLFSHRLWLDKQRAVEYGVEILGTNKTFAPGITHEVSEPSGSVSFEVPGVIRVAVSPQSPLRTLSEIMPGLVLAAGPRKVVSFLTSPVVESQVVSPIGIATGFDKHPPAAHGITVNDGTGTVNAWDEARGDKIELLSDELRVTGFEPTAVQQAAHIRFAILNPFNNH